MADQDYIIIDVQDLGIPRGTCDVCGNTRIRYLHILQDSTGVIHEVGCVCAEKLTGDLTTHRQMEKEVKALARRGKRKTKYKGLMWIKTRKGNWVYYSKSKDCCTVFETKQGKWKWVADGKYSPKTFDTASDAMWFVSEILAAADFT